MPKKSNFLTWSFDQQVLLFKRGRFDLIRMPDPKTGKLLKFSPKQIEAIRLILSGKIKNLGYGGSARAGKTFLLCCFFLLSSFANPDTRYAVGRKKLNNLKLTTIKTFTRLCNKCGIHEVDMGRMDKDKYSYNQNGTDHVIRFNNDSEILFIKTQLEPSDVKDDLARFGSLELTMAAIDESHETDIQVIEILGTRVGNWNNDTYEIPGVLVEVFNPSKGHVKRRYWQPYRDKKEIEIRKFVRALPTDNPSKEVQQYVKDQTDKFKSGELSKATYNRLILGNFDYDDNPNALCGADSISAIFENFHILEDVNDKRIVCDAARLGSDKCITGVFYGWVLVEVHVMDKSLTTEISTLINTLRVKHGVSNYRCIVDEDGVGGGVVDQCRVKGFVNNSAPIPEVIDIKGTHKPNYKNLATQCGYKLAEIINRDQFYIACDLSNKQEEEIIEEIEQLQSWEIDKDSKLMLKPKAKIKEDIGRSPDYLDMFKMNAYFDLKPPKPEYANNLNSMSI